MLVIFEPFGDIAEHIADAQGCVTVGVAAHGRRIIHAVGAVVVE